MKYLLTLLIFTTCCFSEEQSCYRLKKDLIFPYTESTYFRNEEPLAALIRNNNVQSVIEVGSWVGESTIFIAGQLPENGRVYAIDSWIGYPREIYKITKHVYERFLSNVIHANLTQKITPIRGTSLSVSRIFSSYAPSVDMIYIDADHSYKAVYADIASWSKYLKEGGILCGNLYSPAGEEGEIRKAVADYCTANGKRMSIEGFLWVIE